MDIVVYRAQITDPATGEVVVLTATSTDELNELVQRQLAVGYPEGDDDDD